MRFLMVDELGSQDGLIRGLVMVSKLVNRVMVGKLVSRLVNDGS